MDNFQDKETKSRIARLEQDVVELKQLVRNLMTSQPQKTQSKAQDQVARKDIVPSPAEKELPRVPSHIPQLLGGQKPERLPEFTDKRPAPPGRSFELPDQMKTSEYWLNKIGIGLVLFAVVFFFRYSIDKGWLIPWVRIGMAFTLGVVLNFIAFRIYDKRRHFSLVLFGGGIATFYITGFASYQTLALVSDLSAFSFMCAISLYSISVSLKQDEQILSLLGALGGFGTPFLLYTNTGNIPGLVLYTSVLITCVVTVYFFKGWCVLLWVAVGCGWLILALATDQVHGRYVVFDNWSVQFSLIFAWLAFWVIPLLREIRIRGRTLKERRSDSGEDAGLISASLEPTTGSYTNFLVVSSPLVALVLSIVVWDFAPTQTFWGWICMGVGMVKMLVASIVRKWEQFKSLAFTHLMTGLLLLTISLDLLLDGDAFLFALSGEAFVLFLVGRYNAAKGITISSYILYSVIAWILLIRIAHEFSSSTPVLNPKALTDLWAIGTALVVAWLTTSLQTKRVFIVAAFGLLAGWFIRELDGNVLFVSLTAEAVILHYIARVFDDNSVRIAGHFFIAGICALLVDRLLLTRIIEFPIAINRMPLLNLVTFSDSIFMAGLFTVSNILKKKDDKNVYRIVLHIAILGLLLRDFQGLENGQGFVTISWGVYAVILLIAGLRLNNKELRTVSVITLLLVVCKMFLIDLANLETIWRILLFLGFGGAFLFLSYYFKSLWNKK